MKVWYVKFPTYQYNEDVKALAIKNGLKIVDALYDDGKGEKDVPSLTLIGSKVAEAVKEVARKTK